MSKVFAIGWVNTKRFLRERANLFFVFLLPLLIILMLGIVFGRAGDTIVGVYAEDQGPLATGLVDSIDGWEGLSVTRFASEGGLLDSVQRGEVVGGLVIPAGFDDTLAAGGSVELGFVSRPDQSGQLLSTRIRSVVQDRGNLVRAAQFAVVEGAGTFDEGLGAAAIVAQFAESISVSYSETGGDSPLADLANADGFDLGAHQELVLFMFLTSLAGSAALIQTRRLGVARRMLATPTSTATILGGETFGRFNVALIQGVYIVVGTILLFQVDWGDPLGALALVMVFALVGSAAGILAGAVFSNDQQAGGIGVLIGLGMAALGGSMAPIEIFPPAMQTVAKFTPHAWAIDGFSKMVRHGGTFVDILPNLGVLLGFAAVLMLLGTWRLHRVLTH